MIKFHVFWEDEISRILDVKISGISSDKISGILGLTRYRVFLVINFQIFWGGQNIVYFGSINPT